MSNEEYTDLSQKLHWLSDYTEEDFRDLLRDDAVSNEILEAAKDAHITLSRFEIKHNIKYGTFFTTHITHKFFHYLTYDYFVCKILQPVDDNPDYKPGIFDMGICGGRPSEITSMKLIQDISDFLYDMDPNVLSADDDPKSFYERIRKKLFDSAKKGGIKNKFIKLTGIDVDSFDDKYNEYKLWKLLYIFSKTDYYSRLVFGDNYNGIHFDALFSTPAFENMDFSASNYENTRNGQYIALLKNEISKEVPLKFSCRCNYTLTEFSRKWDQVIWIVHDILHEKNLSSLLMIGEETKRSLQSLQDNSLKTSDPPNGNSLLNTVYFWILLNEMKSIRKEIRRINDHISDRVSCYTQISVPRDVPVPISNVDTYISDNMEVLSIYTETLNIALTDFIHDHIKHIQIILDWITEDNAFRITADKPENIPLSFLIATIIAIHDASYSNKKAKHTYYRPSVSGSTLLLSTISHNRKVSPFYKMIWLKKISSIEMTILGMHDLVKTKISIENDIYDIMLNLLTITDLDTFENMDNRLYSNIVQVIPLQYSTFLSPE